MQITEAYGSLLADTGDSEGERWPASMAEPSTADAPHSHK